MTAVDRRHQQQLLRRFFGTAALTASLATCVTPGPLRTGLEFTATTHNIGDAPGRRRPTVAVVAQNLTQEPADLYLLQEVLSQSFYSDLLDALSRLSGKPYYGVYSSSVNLAVFSKTPLSVLETLREGSRTDRWGALLVMVHRPERSFVVANVHLTPVPKRRDAEGNARTGALTAARVVVRERFSETPRSLAAKTLIERLAVVDAPVVIGGDFNTVAASRAVRTIRRHYTDAAAITGTRSGTYRRVTSRIQPRIDFLFFSAEFQILQAAVLQLTVGDHYPVSARIRLQQLLP